MRISVVGTGYVGLVTGACLSSRGHDVTCVDLDPQRVAALNAAKSPIFEQGLEELLQSTVGRSLRATTNLEEAVLKSEVTFIAVGTPFNGDTIDLTAVLAAARQIGSVLRHKDAYHVVVVKSTVVPGTTDGCVIPALESASTKKAGVDFGVGMNPEFLSEGEAVHDFMFPDRIVLGGIDEKSLAALEAIYAPFTDAPRLRVSLRTAEMTKYASNALLACLISFSNELANLGVRLGNIDAAEVMRGVHLSHYFRGRNGEGLPPITAFLKPGCGFGGSCLPKDVSALIAHGRAAGEEMALLDAVIRINGAQPERVMDLLHKHWASLDGVRVAVLGLAFKPGTSDVRESPAFPIIRELRNRGAVVTAHDPVAIPEARGVISDTTVGYVEDLPTALDNVDAVVVVTAWPEFETVPAMLSARHHQPVFVDCRRAFDKRSVARYEGVGL